MCDTINKHRYVTCKARVASQRHLSINFPSPMSQCNLQCIVVICTVGMMLEPLSVSVCEYCGSCLLISDFSWYNLTPSASHLRNKSVGYLQHPALSETSIWCCSPNCIWRRPDGWMSRAFTLFIWEVIGSIHGRVKPNTCKMVTWRHRAWSSVLLGYEKFVSCWFMS